jgi:CheY-like chemotaxis protein
MEDTTGMKRRILVIDDDPDMVRIIRAILEKHGVIVDVAVHGKDAIAKMVENRPEIVFLDLMMPELDGFEIVEALCSSGVARPRIFVLTAKHLSPQEKAYLEKHVEMIIPKGTDELAGILDKVMRGLPAA